MEEGNPSLHNRHKNSNSEKYFSQSGTLKWLGNRNGILYVQIS